MTKKEASLLKTLLPSTKIITKVGKEDSAELVTKAVKSASTGLVLAFLVKEAELDDDDLKKMLQIAELKVVKELEELTHGCKNCEEHFINPIVAKLKSFTEGWDNA